MPSLWEGQLLHLGGLTASSLLALFLHSVTPSSPPHHSPTLSLTHSLFYSILTLRALHHTIITCIWRLQLHSPHSLTSLLHSKSNALIATTLIDVGYIALAGSGFITVALLDSESLYTMTHTSSVIGVILSSVGIWTILSAVCYIGPKGLAGADHFYPEEYRVSKGVSKLVSKGVYKYMSHPLYKIGMLLEWGVAVMAGSWLCFVLALSAHLSALSFMWGTEIPDMRHIYGDDGVECVSEIDEHKKKEEKSD
jgi:protein-S-isoprenylcysteine O-methyltransferase Ste14